MRTGTTTRRRFAFWVGMGLFQLGERLSADGLDNLAAATMRLTDSTDDPRDRSAEHWTVEENNTWRWFQRESFVDGRWQVTGITTPIHKRTAKPYLQETGYLDESLVPKDLREGMERHRVSVLTDTGDERPGQADPGRKARHGRPPSKWLRSLHAEELRVWLKTIQVPEAGVEGVTFFTHLTRDHFFEAARISGLTIGEQAKLHAAAHAGY